MGLARGWQKARGLEIQGRKRSKSMQRVVPSSLRPITQGRPLPGVCWTKQRADTMLPGSVPGGCCALLAEYRSGGE